MSSGHRWQDLIGLETIKVIVKKVVPTWMNSLHVVQLDLVSGILDGRDILCCTATGDGKSAAFAIACLVLLEYNNNPEAYLRGQQMALQIILYVLRRLSSFITHSLLGQRHRCRS